MLDSQKDLKHYIRHKVICELKYQILHRLIKYKILSQTIDELTNKYLKEVTSCYFSPYITNLDDAISNLIKWTNKQQYIFRLLIEEFYWPHSIYGGNFWNEKYIQIRKDEINKLNS